MCHNSFIITKKGFGKLHNTQNGRRFCGRLAKLLVQRGEIRYNTPIFYRITAIMRVPSAWGKEEGKEKIERKGVHVKHNLDHHCLCDLHGCDDRHRRGFLQEIQQPVRLFSGRPWAQCLGRRPVRPGIRYVRLAADGPSRRHLPDGHRPGLDCGRPVPGHAAQLEFRRQPSAPV